MQGLIKVKKSYFYKLVISNILEPVWMHEIVNLDKMNARLVGAYLISNLSSASAYIKDSRFEYLRLLPLQASYLKTFLDCP